VTKVVVNRVPVFTPRPAFCFVTSRLRVRFCRFAPARSHNPRLCVLCVLLWLRSSAPFCVNLRHSAGPPVRPSRKNRNRVNRVNGVIDRWCGPGRSSRSQAALRAAAATDRRIAPARHGAMCPSPRRPTNTGTTERNDDRMTSACPAFAVRHSFSVGGSAFAASRETSALPFISTPCLCVPFAFCPAMSPSGLSRKSLKYGGIPVEKLHQIVQELKPL
jgi:hypothetical protein